MLISAIKQNSPERLTVVFTSGEELKTTLSAVTELRLCVGKELDDSGFKELKTLSARTLGRERALEYISRRRMSRRELIDKLREKGEDEETAEYCADWLESRGFIDDASYAGAVVRHYAAKGYGIGRIRQELSRRGIAIELWEDAEKELPGGTDKLDRLIAQRLRDPSDRDEVRKLSAMLYRRGFSWEEIRAGLERFGSDTEDDT